MVKITQIRSLDLSGNVLNDTSISSLVALSSIRSLLLNGMVLTSARTIQRELHDKLILETYF